LAQPVVSNRSIIPFDIGILLWISRLNKVHSPAFVDTLRYGQRLGFCSIDPFPALNPEIEHQSITPIGALRTAGQSAIAPLMFNPIQRHLL
jgi:hypothetical protein